MNFASQSTLISKELVAQLLDISPFLCTHPWKKVPIMRSSIVVIFRQETPHIPFMMGNVSPRPVETFSWVSYRKGSHAEETRAASNNKNNVVWMGLLLCKTALQNSGG